LTRGDAAVWKQQFIQTKIKEHEEAENDEPDWRTYKEFMEALKKTFQPYDEPAEALEDLLTTEAEYVAATHAAKEAVWIQQLIGEIFWPLTIPMTLYSDSKSAIALVKDGHYHAHTKHIDICYHFIQYIIEAETIKLIYCPTDEMTADTLTKALPNVKAKNFATALGLCMVWGGVLNIMLFGCVANRGVILIRLSHLRV
jgi:hypothetical protein